MSGDEPGGMTREEARQYAERHAKRLATMTREKAIAALDAYHAAHMAAHMARQTGAGVSSVQLDRARTALDEAASAPWQAT